MPTRGQSEPPLVGVLRFGDPPDELFREPFLNALREKGLEDGRTIRLAWRYAHNSHREAAELAGELVHIPVRVIVAGPTPAAHAAKDATNTIPIVIFTGNPVGTGLVQSLARPGGNVTGVAALSAELAAKRLELIREIIPRAQRIGLLVRPSDPFSRSFIGIAEAAASQLGAQTLLAPAERTEEVVGAFESLAWARVDAILVQDVLRDSYERIAELQLLHRVPVVGESSTLTEFGGLLKRCPASACSMTQRARR
jgi:putative ABC transport system substrate-binding protein